ncbi:MAG: efflux RND transporter periplasmic adaptor subunit [Bacteroidetes bacterium]|nr:efflux RND transporter periplasmic adaptor subunit [Bacteroidota bacterium]
MNFNLFKNLLVIAIIGLILMACGDAPQAEENSSSQMAEETNKGVPVEVMVVSKKSIEQNIPLTGVLTPINSVDLIAEVSGKIIEVRKELGSKISKSDTLAVIDERIPRSNYEQAKAQVLSAENNLRIAKINVDSDKELLEQGDISKLAYENSVFNYKSAEANLLAAKANFSVQKKALDDTRITSPISGLVARKNVELGTMINMGTTMYRVVDLNTLKVNVGVPQALIGNVKKGDKAVIDVSGIGNGKFYGIVKHISPQADEETGSFQVEIHVANNSEMKMRAGMTAKVNLVVAEDEDKLVIPDYAIVTMNGGNYAYKLADGQAKLTELKLGKAYGSQIEVYEGLNEGDKIVVVGMKNLGVDTKVWVETVN